VLAWVATLLQEASEAREVTLHIQFKHAVLSKKLKNINKFSKVVAAHASYHLFPELEVPLQTLPGAV
jgi:hypothetical protein